MNLTPWLFVFAAGSLAVLGPSSFAQNCSNTSIGSTPINDLGAGTYMGFPGGLYPGGANSRPAMHETAGLAQAALVVPRDGNGNPDPVNGEIGVVSIGMSNTSQEFTAFIDLGNADPEKSPAVVLVNGAQGGQDIEKIVDPQAQFWTNVDSALSQRGLTVNQAQVFWFKEAKAGANGSFPQHAETLRDQFITVMGIIKDRYPHAYLVFASSRIYAGYATGPLNPEPYAYESGFAVKWMIEEQINGNPDMNFDPNNGPVEVPWVSWGPYTWADGLTPRSDGLIWECADFAPDGTHPSAQGADKVASMLLDMFQNDSTAEPWYKGSGGNQEVLVLTQTALRQGRNANFRVMEALPNETIHYLYSLSGTGSGSCPPELGGNLCLDLLNPVVLFGSTTANGQGVAQLSVTVPSNAPLVAVSTQAVAQRGTNNENSVKSNTVTDTITP